MTATSQDQSRPDPTLKMRREDLERAVAARVIHAEQAEALWRFLEVAAAGEAGMAMRPRFDLVHVLWYAGALIVIGAMGLFATLALAQLGGGALAVIALTYAVLFGFAGDRLWRRGLMIPGGLLITVAVTMAPLFVYGVQDALGWLHGAGHVGYRGFYAFCRWSIGSWVPMELAAIAAGLIALRFYRFPFLIAPIAVALWFLSLDLAPWVLGREWDGWRPRRLVSFWFGLAVLVVAWVVDIRARGDFAFWLHLFGLLAFWGGLTSLDSDSELARAVYCLINIGLLALALFLQRRAYALFGGLGVALYLYHLAERVFQDSLLYPFALSLIGLAVLGAGLLLHRHGAALEQALQGRLPQALVALRPAHTR
jgi:hypothetical protein